MTDQPVSQPNLPDQPVPQPNLPDQSVPQAKPLLKLRESTEEDQKAEENHTAEECQERA